MFFLAMTIELRSIMPIDVFDAIRGNISSFLGGAAVDLLSGDAGIVADDTTLSEIIFIEDRPYCFTARREVLSFTRSETAFCRELLTAFSGLFSGFRQEGYAAHFRTALLASIMDITVARSLRGDHRKGFWPIQQLIQLLKNLSYQRYEGKPATTGFIVHRTTPSLLRKLVRERQHKLIPIQPHVDISPDFFCNPLPYRFVAGNNLFFVANIQMQVTGVLRTSPAVMHTDIERLTQREIFSIVRRVGTGAFAVTVNVASEIEVLMSPATLLVRRKGDWTIFDPDIFRSFLAGSIDAESIDELLWTVYALSKDRHGTVILIYDKGPKKLALLKKGSVGGNDPISRFLIGNVQKRTISDLKRTGILLHILSADGMTVFNKSGRLMEAGFIFDTSYAREVVTGGGRTTAASAASYFGKVIKVSQDGPIELYQDGRVVYRFG
jgi:DNA integrity scanning protein DisA with diadenylate cyclase activity